MRARILSEARTLPIIACVIFLTSCSRLGLAYRFIEWYIPYYIGTYVQLSDSQNAYLEKEIDELFAWHCRTQLAIYADLIRRANADYQTGAMTRTHIDVYLAEIETLMRIVMQQASPTIAHLLANGTQEQINELFYKFAIQNEEWRENFYKITSNEIREEYQRNMTKQLERWFGSLNKGQRRAVRDWSDRFQPLGLEGLGMRQGWQERLRALIAIRRDEPAFSAGIDDLLVNPGATRSAEVQVRMEYNVRVTIDLVDKVGSELEGRQLRYLDRQMSSLARDLDELACAQ